MKEKSLLPTVNIKELEVLAIQQVYKENKGITRKRAAELLGMSERNLYRKIVDNKIKL